MNWRTKAPEMVNLFKIVFFRSSRYWKAMLVLCTAIQMIGCKPIFEEKAEDKLLASVYDKKLYSSTIGWMIPEGATEEEKLIITKSYINRWVGDMLMLHEAEKNIPKDWNIDKLVEDYKSSLIRHNYEQALIDKLLDSTVTDRELQAFYEKNSRQYELEKPIFRCYLIKIKNDVKLPKDFLNWWKEAKTNKASYRQLSNFCAQHAEAYFLQDSAWHNIDDLVFALPKDALTEDNIRSKREFIQRDEQYDYYYKNFEVINKKEIAPLSYIQGQAKRYILKQKKQVLLERTRKEMYETGKRNNKVRILIND